MITAAEKGIFQPGETSLHNLDPRIKVAATLIMVILNFAATSWGELLVVAAVLCVVFYILDAIAGSLWRMLWFLRWLLLFTFLLHLFFTPGRTMWGVSWLSYDGFLTGSFTSAQLMAAVLFASSMTLTTKVEDIVGALGWFARPLSRVGINTASWERMSLLVLNFIPIVCDQIKQSKSVPADANGNDNSFVTRWSTWTQKLNSFVVSLVDRADGIAKDLVAEGEQQSLSEKLPSLFPMTLLDRLFLLSLAVVLCGYWLAIAIL